MGGVWLGLGCLHSQVCDADTTTDRQTAKRHIHNGSARSRAIESGATQWGRLIHRRSLTPPHARPTRHTAPHRSRVHPTTLHRAHQGDSQIAEDARGLRVVLRVLLAVVARVVVVVREDARSITATSFVHPRQRRLPSRTGPLLQVRWSVSSGSASSLVWSATESPQRLPPFSSANAARQARSTGSMSDEARRCWALLYATSITSMSLARGTSSPYPKYLKRESWVFAGRRASMHRSTGVRTPRPAGLNRASSHDTHDAGSS